MKLCHPNNWTEWDFTRHQDSSFDRIHWVSPVSLRKKITDKWNINFIHSQVPILFSFFQVDHVKREVERKFIGFKPVFNYPFLPFPFNSYFPKGSKAWIWGVTRDLNEWELKCCPYRSIFLLGDEMFLFYVLLSEVLPLEALFQRIGN